MRKIYFLISILIVPFFLFAAEPTAPTSDLTTRFVEGNSIEFLFKKGNGAERIAIVKKGSPVTARPQNGNSYLANGTFGSGQEIGPGEFVVYNGSHHTSFVVYGLVPETEYFIAFFEVNGSGLNSEFLTSSFLKGSASTLTKPTLQPTNFSVSSITGNDMRVSWEAGDGKNRIVLARRGGPVNANPVELIRYDGYPGVEYFGTAKIGDKNMVVYAGAGNSVNLSEMYPDTTYHFAIFEYNGNNGPVYLTTNPLRGSAKTLPQPTVASRNISFYQIEANQMIFQCTPGNGTRRIVVMREGAPIEAFPQKNMDYGSNDYFDASPEIAPGHKVVFDGPSNSFRVYNLEIGTIYYIAIFEYSGAESNRGYLISEYAAVSQSTQGIPGINVTNIDTVMVLADKAQLKFIPGNGNGRLIVVKKDAPVDFVPNNFKTYNVHTTYGSTFGELGNGNYAVSKGANSGVEINLQPNTRFHVAAFEYNGTNFPVYNTTNVDTFSFTTKLPPAPTNPSIKIAFSDVEGNSMRVNWVKGNGERRIVM